MTIFKTVPKYYSTALGPLRRNSLRRSTRKAASLGGSLARSALAASGGRVARQSKWSVAITTAEFVRGIIQVYLVTRILGLEQYGVLGMIYAATGLMQGSLAVLSNQAITTFAGRALADGRKEEASAVLWYSVRLTLLLGAASYAALVVAAYAGPKLLNPAAGAGEALTAVLTTDRDALLVYGLIAVLHANHKDTLAVLRVTDRIQYGIFVVAGTTLFQLVALLAVWKNGGTLQMVALVLAATAAINCVGMFGAAIVSARQVGLPFPRIAKWSQDVPLDVVKFLRISFWQTKAGVLSWQLDTLIVGQLTSASQTGLYVAARKIADPVALMIVPITQTIQTEFSRRWFSKDRAGVRSLAFGSTGALLVAGAVVCGGLFVFREQVILFLDREFSGSAETLVLLLPGLFAAFAIAGLVGLPAAAGRMWPSVIWTTAAVAVQMVALLLLVPVYGANGAAVSRTVFSVILATVVIPFAVPMLRRRDSQ